MSRLGIGDDTTVVAYDDSGGGTAGRLVVMLRMLGRRAALLSGGLRAWTGAVETGPATTPTPAEFTATPWPADRVSRPRTLPARTRQQEARSSTHAPPSGSVARSSSPTRVRGTSPGRAARRGHR
jgi:3-mercaptopyruvate sulfurtransferase SseA